VNKAVTEFLGAIGVCGDLSISCWAVVGTGRDPLADIDASVLHCFFDDKVAGVRAAATGAAAPQFTAAPVGCELRVFSAVTRDDVAAVSGLCLTSSAHLIRCLLGC